MKKLLGVIVFSLFVLTGCDNTPPPEPVKQINNPSIQQAIDNPDTPSYDNPTQDLSTNPIVSSIDDKIQANSMWCGTFQLVWNDMIDKVVKKDVIFDPQLIQAENLNKKTFTKNELSDNSYFLTYGLFTKTLKKNIEEGIKQKFNETSAIINMLDWESAPENDDGYPVGGPKQYVFYTMLKKVFNFAKEFDKRDPEKFDDKYDNINYFGIKGSSPDYLYSQVKVLYYNSDSDFAVTLKTNEGEDVILSRGIMEDSFLDSYRAIMAKSEEYDGKKSFGDFDYLKVPNLSINTLRSYDEFLGKDFYNIDGNRCEIKKAVQTIEFDLDEKGGKIKSEALIYMQADGAIGPSFEEIKRRYFYFDKPFMIFLKEENKQLPYFAAQITDITLFQK